MEIAYLEHQARDEISKALAYSVAASARQLGVSAPVIYREIREGRLNAFKLGRRTLVAADDLELLVRRLKLQPFIPADTRRAVEARHSVYAPTAARPR